MKRTRRHLTIPECRSLLQVIARSLAPSMAARQIRYVIGHMTRRKPVRRTRVKSRAMTPRLKLRIRMLAQAFPDASQVEIGRMVGVNPGRVSEALAGKRR